MLFQHPPLLTPKKWGVHPSPHLGRRLKAKTRPSSAAVTYLFQKLSWWAVRKKKHQLLEWLLFFFKYACCEHTWHESWIPSFVSFVFCILWKVLHFVWIPSPGSPSCKVAKTKLPHGQWDVGAGVCVHLKNTAEHRHPPKREKWNTFGHTNKLPLAKRNTYPVSIFVGSFSREQTPFWKMEQNRFNCMFFPQTTMTTFIFTINKYGTLCCCPGESMWVFPYAVRQASPLVCGTHVSTSGPRRQLGRRNDLECSAWSDWPGWKTATTTTNTAKAAPIRE